jgi:hypothetical protein
MLTNKRIKYPVPVLPVLPVLPCPYAPLPASAIANVSCLGNALIIDEGVDNAGRCALARHRCYSGYGRYLAQLPQQRPVGATHHGLG